MRRSISTRALHAAVLGGLLAAAVPAAAQTPVTVRSCRPADLVLGEPPESPRVPLYLLSDSVDEAVVSSPRSVPGERPGLGHITSGLTAWFAFERPHGGADGTYWLRMMREADTTRNGTDRHVTLVTDDSVHIDLGDARSIMKVEQWVSRRYGTRHQQAVETLLVRVPPPVAVKIAFARFVRGQMGSTGFSFEGDTVEALGSVIRYAVCTWHAPAPTPMPVPVATS